MFRTGSITSGKPEQQLIDAATRRLQEERQRRGPLTRWQEVEILEAAGLQRDQISAVLDLHPSTIWDHQQTVIIQKIRQLSPDEHRQLSRRSLARRMASVYPDRERQQWILRQMGVEE